MEELSEEQIEEFKEAFSLFDHEGNGHIYTKELGTVLRSLGIHTTDDEKTAFIDKFDTTGEGFIYFKNFLEIIITKIAETKTEDELTEAFKLFDRSKKVSFLTLSNFKEDIKTYCKGIDNNETEEICSILKYKETPYIKIEEAVQKLMEKIKPHLN